MSDIELDTTEDLVNLAKALPEEGKKDFMAVLVSLQDGDINTQEALAYMKTIFEEYKLVH